MGRINLTPLRVRKRALANVQTKRTSILPNWIDIVGDIPPAQILTRPQPLQHQLTQVRARALPNGHTQQYVQVADSRRSKTAKRSKMFSPNQIRYEEDSLRKQFFSDHPWELARPRIVLETTGDQHRNADWSTGLLQPGIPLSGESVVQRQLWLLQNSPGITISQAYDIARIEFYRLRQQEATRRRVAAEEAEATGAQFGPSAFSWGMQIENKMYNEWEQWARNINLEMESKTAAFSGAAQKPEKQAAGSTVGYTARPGQNSTRVMPIVERHEVGATVFANRTAGLQGQDVRSRRLGN